jgi:hypothetical protein
VEIWVCYLAPGKSLPSQALVKKDMNVIARIENRTNYL